MFGVWPVSWTMLDVGFAGTAIADLPVWAWENAVSVTTARAALNKRAVIVFPSSKSLDAEWGAYDVNPPRRESGHVLGDGLIRWRYYYHTSPRPTSDIPNRRAGKTVLAGVPTLGECPRRASIPGPEIMRHPQVFVRPKVPVLAAGMGM